MYAGADFRSTDPYRASGQLADYGLLPLAAVPLVSSLISSLNPFDSSGPNQDNWNKRARRISLAIEKANAGDIMAWYLLGTHGKPAVPTPVPIGMPYIGSPIPAGWTVDRAEGGPWGVAYDPLRKQAREAWVSLAPRYQGGAAVPVTTPAPVSLPGQPLPPPVSTMPIPFPTQPAPFPGNNIPVYQPDPTQGQIPATMQPLQEASVFGMPKTLATFLGVLAVGALLVNAAPRRNPPRRARRSPRRTRRRR